MRVALGVLILTSLCAWSSSALGQEPDPSGEVVGDSEEISEGKGVVRHIAFYLPNRVFDVLDVARARARIGGGMAVSARATQLAAVFLGGYSTVYVGLAGPRSQPEIPWPFGVDEKTGIQISVADRTSHSDYGPRYTATEAGAGFQVLGIGLDVGVDPVEVLDLVTGLFLIDLRGDDY